MSLHDEVKKYFTECFKDVSMEDLFMENNDQTLTFSFIMGLPPEECRYMEVEPEFTDEDIRQFDEVEGEVCRIRREFMR